MVSGEIGSSFTIENNSSFQLPYYVQTYSGARIRDIATGRLLQWYTTSDYGKVISTQQNIYSFERKECNVGFTINMIDLETGKRKVFEKGL